MWQWIEGRIVDSLSCACVCALTYCLLLAAQTLAAYFKAQQLSELPLSHSLTPTMCVCVCAIDICEVSLKYQFMAQADKVPNLHLIFSIV